MRFLLVAGRPLKEPVAWQGPIVMNTREELMRGDAGAPERELHQGVGVASPRTRPSGRGASGGRIWAKKMETGDGRDQAAGISSAQTRKLCITPGPKVVVSATSAASRP